MCRRVLYTHTHTHVVVIFSLYVREREEKSGTSSAGTLARAGDGGWHRVMPVSVWRQRAEGTVCVCER